MARKVLALLAGCLFLVGAAACSKSDETTTSAPPATASSKSSDDETTTTEKSSSDDDETTTTKKKSSSGDKADPKVQSLVDELETTLESSSGVEFTDEETQCMVDYFVENPDLLDVDPTSGQQADAEAFMGVVVECIPKDRFVDLIIANAGLTLTSSQEACVREKLLELSADDYVGVMTGDPAITKQLQDIGSECATA